MGCMFHCFVKGMGLSDAIRSRASGVWAVEISSTYGFVGCVIYSAYGFSAAVISSTSGSVYCGFFFTYWTVGGGDF